MAVTETVNIERLKRIEATSVDVSDYDSLCEGCNVLSSCLCLGYVDSIGTCKHGPDDVCLASECLSVCEIVLCAVPGEAVK